MYNRDNRETHNSEVRQETYQDAQGNTHTRVTRNADTVNTRTPTTDEVSYRDGYVSGQVTERELRDGNQIARDNDNAARGLLIGIILTSLLGLVLGTLFFLNQRRETPAPVAPIIVPNRSVAPAAKPSPSPVTKTETRIIERDRVVPVPQPQAPAPQAPAPAPAPAPTVNVAPAPAPDVNITVPSNPAPAPTQPQTGNDTTSTQGSSGSTTDTAPSTNDLNTGDQSDTAPTTEGTSTTGNDTTNTGGTSGTTGR
ncbi:hypothetical protein [Trichocoleus sp. FACHB-262]|uniref:hypothetical protein n=1 Tax=Trichocoleus sp. FACHB-262 TaxID=2692869 RepID=UPI001689A209|nr:hypothetical protein [Trichocoleus sp. FACHB-262]MBD2124168.1 hypothetical protein [Trichocoleus sp. FACHB-262]